MRKTKRKCQFCKKTTKRRILFEDARIGGELILCMGCYNGICEGYIDLTKATATVKKMAAGVVSLRESIN